VKHNARGYFVPGQLHDLSDGRPFGARQVTARRHHRLARPTASSPDAVVAILRDVLIPFVEGRTAATRRRSTPSYTT
jgi:hypothetical protein